MTDKLKPCPFCGGYIELIKNVSDSYWTPPLGVNEAWWFKCTKCRWVFNYTYDNNMIPEFEHMESLIEKFNTRKPIDRIVEQLEKLAEEHSYKVQGDFDTYSQYNEAWEDCIDRAIEIVKAGAEHET